MDLKPHWLQLIEKMKQYRNGTVVIDFQDGLPIRVVTIEGKDRDIDLTKTNTD